MWVRFTRKPYVHWIAPEGPRRGYTYFPGECLDLPEKQARAHLDALDAEPAEPPEEFRPAEPFIPPSLGRDPLTVACVWRTGGVYDHHDYVGPLARAVKRNLALPHRFVCLTDAPASRLPPGVEPVPLLHDWRRYWAKVELYRPGLFSGPVLYLDLDTVVCGDITEIASADDPVLAAWDLNRGWLNSSLLRWSVDLSFVYRRMADDPAGTMAAFTEPALYGDQGLLQDELTRRNVPWRWVQARFPGQVVWQPNAERQHAAPAGTRISMWYGDPKPHEVTGSAFLAEHWR
jgi:hypothetical protein